MLHVPDWIVDQTLADLKSRLPQEGVGLWCGKGLEVQQWLLLTNVAADARTGYRVHPQEWLDVLVFLQAADLTPLALVHSHPTAAAVPSRRDVQEWMYPELWCVIVSFQTQPPVWAAHQIKKRTPL